MTETQMTETQMTKSQLGLEMTESLNCDLVKIQRLREIKSVSILYLGNQLVCW